MQTYLLAANLFAMTALLIGINNFAKNRYSWRLLPLFLLTICRSLIFILFLKGVEDDGLSDILPIITSLDVFSVFFIVWSLVRPGPNLPEMWQRLFLAAGGGAFFLSVLPLIPAWPIPYQLHGLLIVILGAPLILVTLGEIGWIHLFTLLLIAGANFLSLVGLNNVSGLTLLVGYGFLVAALHWEGVQIYRERQQSSKSLAQEALILSRERQRLLEVSEIISTVPGLDEAMIHVARSLAHITHSDQAAIFTLDVSRVEKAHLAAIYSPERPVDLSYHDQITINLSESPPLQAAMSNNPQQILLTHSNDNIFSEANLRGVRPTSRQIPGLDAFDEEPTFEVDPASLDSLYTLWNEERSGPTFIQPLTIQGNVVGALVLGNPVTKRAIRKNDQILINSLASQIATIVEAYRHYIDLELQLEFLSTPEAKSEPKLEPPTFDEIVAMSQAQQPVHTSESPLVAETTSPQAFSPLAAQATPINPSGFVFEVEGGNQAEHYLAILETVDDGVVVSNATGRVQMVNRSAERILGKSRDELLGQPIGTVYGKIDSGEPIENLAMAFSRRNQPLPTYMEDEDQAIQGHLIPWRNVDSEWLGIIVVFRDVTHQIRSDKARNNSITALSRALRGPLGIIKGYAELFAGGNMGDFSGDQLRAQQIMHSNAERMAQTLDNALQISMQNKRELLPQFEKVNVNKVIDEIIYEMNPMIQLSELKFIQDVKSDLPIMTADPRHLYRILENLISNACRFTPPGGQISLRVWIQRERDSSLNRAHILLAVADSGVGIPEIELKRIFDPFYQLGTQKPDERPGLGMGLAVVKELVEWHNGKVWVESLLGEGSIFQVSLPLHHH